MITINCSMLSGDVHVISIDDTNTFQDLIDTLDTYSVYHGQFINIIYDGKHYNLDNFDFTKQINSIFKGNEENKYNIVVMLEKKSDIPEFDNIKDLIEYGNDIGSKKRLYQAFFDLFEKITKMFRNLEGLNNLINKDLILYICDKGKNSRELLNLYLNLNNEMKEDYDIVVKFLKEIFYHKKAATLFPGFALNIPKKFKTKKFYIDCINDRIDIFRYMPTELKQDREIVLLDSRKLGYNLGDEEIPANLKDDREIVLLAVTNSGEVLNFASDRLRNDIEIVTAAVNQDITSFFFAGNEIRKNRVFSLELSKEHRNGLMYIDDSFKNDIDFIIEVLKTNPESIRIVKKEIREDVNFIIRVKAANLEVEKFMRSTMYGY